MKARAWHSLILVSLGLSTFTGCSSGGALAPSSDDASTGNDGASPIDAGAIKDTTAPIDTGIDAESSASDATSADVDVGDAEPIDAPLDHAADTSPCQSAPTTDFYVDSANGNDTSTGAAAGCALKTITAALTASAAHDNATIHLAPGTYSAGETFPLVVNHGRSLVGAGAGSTKIQGSSAAYATSATQSFLDTGVHYVTLIAGDRLGGATTYGRTTLSGFTLLPAAAVTTPTTGYLGLVCIAGNAPNTGTPPPLPTENLLLQSLVVGPNYDLGVAIGSTPAQSTACNAVITGSTFTGMNVGLETGVCGTANPVGSWPSAQVGDGVSSDANTFSASTIDLFGAGCGSAQSIDGNHFPSGYRGIVLVSQAAQYFEILGNDFDGKATPFAMGIGVQTNATATIDRLDANTFTNIAQSAAADTAAGQATGFALLVGSVLQAHQNVIHDNDNGVGVSVAPAVTFDFSSDGSAANANEIYCNAKPSSSGATGYDVVLSYSAGLSANFAGNIWDHAAPTTGTSLTATANGSDLVTGASSGATLTGSSAIGTAACASGRAH